MRVLYFAALVSVAVAAPLEHDAFTTTKKETIMSSSGMSGMPWMSEEARMGRHLAGDMDAAKMTKFTKMEQSSVPVWEQGKLAASARSAWGSDDKYLMARPAALGASWDSRMTKVGADGRMVAVGRSAWDSSAAHLHKDAHPDIEILQQQYEMAPQPGSYVYSYKTANGIEAQEQAALKAEDSEAVQGAYSWVAPSGEKFAVEYVADETGYHARGAHIPEIPEAIARSLEWNAAHPEEDDHSWETAESSAAWTNRAKLAAGRSAWDSKLGSSFVPTDARLAAGRSAWDSKLGSSFVPTDARLAAGRSAWDSKLGSSFVSTDARLAAGRPAWESKFASSMESDARLAAGRSAWESGSYGADANLGGATKITKVTKTVVPSGMAAESGLFATGRSAWASESALPLGGATKITKITKTSTVGGPAAFSGLDMNADAKLVADSHAAWESQQAPRLGFGRSTVTKVVEHSQHGPEHSFKL